MIELISRDAADGLDWDDRADSGDVADGGGERDDSADSNVGLMEWTFFDDGAVGSGQGLYEREGEAGRSYCRGQQET